VPVWRVFFEAVRGLRRLVSSAAAMKLNDAVMTVGTGAWEHFER
jgi:hypothetical protein